MKERLYLHNMKLGKWGKSDTPSSICLSSRWFGFGFLLGYKQVTLVVTWNTGGWNNITIVAFVQYGFMKLRRLIFHLTFFSVMWLPVVLCVGTYHISKNVSTDVLHIEIYRNTFWETLSNVCRLHSSLK